MEQIAGDVSKLDEQTRQRFQESYRAMNEGFATARADLDRGLADAERRRWTFYRLHAPDPIWFSRDIRFTIQSMGGASAERVRELLDKQVPCIPVTLVDDGQVEAGRFLYKANEPLPEKGWINYYRSDDYAAATWFYLDRKENTLPRVAPLAERVDGV